MALSTEFSQVIPEGGPTMQSSEIRLTELSHCAG